MAEDAVGACATAVDNALDPLLARVRRHVVQTMTSLAASKGPVSCALRAHHRDLHVALSGPRVSEDIEHALAVRVADAVRADGRPYTTVDVSYHATS